TVDAEAVRPARSTRVLEPTGWPVATNSSTRRRRISCWRDERCNLMLICRRILRQELGRNGVAQKAAAFGQRERVAAGASREAEAFHTGKAGRVERVPEACERERLVEPEAEHDPFPRPHVAAHVLELAVRRP